MKIFEICNIPGMEKFPGYFLTSTGFVISHKWKNPSVLRPGKSRKISPYHFVRLSSKDGEKKQFYIHRLVAMAFLPCEDTHKIEVNHKNRNGLDNNVNNLEWVTHRENSEHYKNFNDDESIMKRYRDLVNLDGSLK
jgi:hypothetical protein